RNFINNTFLALTMSYGKSKKKLSKFAQGKTIVHLHGTNFRKLSIYLPIFDKQIKIKKLITNIEKNINLHRQKLLILYKIKRQYLNKLFPANGNNEPELRFNNFEKEWEQRKLNDVTKKIGSGKTPKGGNSVYIKSGVPFLRSQNINHDSVSFDEIVYISESMNEGMLNSVVIKNDVLLNITGASIGRSAVYALSDPANVNQHVCIIRPNQEVNPYFIQLNITSDKGQKQIKNNQAGGGREGLNFQQIGKMSFSYPNSSEQTKIERYFKHLDNIITLHQRK